MMQEGFVEEKVTDIDNLINEYGVVLAPPIRTGKVFQYIAMQAEAPTVLTSRRAVTQKFSEESFEKNITAFMPQHYKSVAKYDFQGANDLSEKIIYSIYPLCNSQQQDFLKHCLEDNWLFFCQFDKQDFFDSTKSPLSQAPIYFLNYLGAQKTLNNIFKNRDSHILSNDNNASVIDDISSAIYCNQMHFLNDYFQLSSNKLNIKKSHFELAFSLRNINLLRSLEEQNKKVYQEFETVLLSKSPDELIQQVSEPFFSKESAELLKYCAKKIKHFYRTISLDVSANLFQIVDVETAKQILFNARALKSLTREQKSQLIGKAYVAGNLNLAFYLEYYFQIDFSIVFHALKHLDNIENKDAYPLCDQVLMFLARAKQEDRFTIGLGIIKSDKLTPNQFPCLFSSVMRCQDVVNFKWILTIFKEKSNEVADFIIQLIASSDMPHLFFEMFSRLEQQQKIPDEFKSIYICQKIIKSSYFKNQSPVFYLSFLFFIQKNKFLTFVTDEFYAEMAASFNRKSIDFPYYTTVQLQHRDAFQNLFDSLCQKISKQSLMSKSLEDFFAYLLRQNVVCWNSSFNQFVWQTGLTFASIQNVFFFPANNKKYGVNFLTALFLTAQEDDVTYLGYFAMLEKAFKTVFLTAADSFITIFSELFKKTATQNIDTVASIQWAIRLPEMVRAHFTLEQSIRLLPLFLSVHLDEALLKKKNDDEMKADFSLFCAIADVMDEKFLSDAKQRSEIIKTIDNFLKHFLMSEGTKTSPGHHNTELLFEKINYLNRLILKHVKSLSFPETEQTFKKMVPGFKKLLESNNVVLLVTRQKLQPAILQGNSSDFVPLEEDHHMIQNGGSNGVALKMMHSAQMSQSSIDDDGFTALEIAEPVVNATPKKTTSCWCWPWQCGKKQIKEEPDNKPEEYRSLTK